MAGLEIEVQPVAGDERARKVALSGVVDSSTAAQIEARIGALAEEGVLRVIVLMHRVRYVNDDGLAALERLTALFRERGGGLALVGVSTRIRLMIDMMGKAETLQIFDDESAAMAALAESAAASQPAAPTPAAQPQGAASGAQQPAETQRLQPSAPAAAGAGGLFPAAVACGGCGVELELYGPGNWKCPRCGVLLAARADGTVSFSAPAGAPPYELVLHGGDQALEGLQRFVAAVAAPVLGPEGAGTLGTAAAEVGQAIVQHAYGGDATEPWQVAVEPGEGKVQLRFADHGEAFESSRLAQQLPFTSQAVSELQCERHPRGGNLLRLVMYA